MEGDLPVTWGSGCTVHLRHEVGQSNPANLSRSFKHCRASYHRRPHAVGHNSGGMDRTKFAEFLNLFRVTRMCLRRRGWKRGNFPRQSWLSLSTGWRTLCPRLPSPKAFAPDLSSGFQHPVQRQHALTERAGSGPVGDGNKAVEQCRKELWTPIFETGPSGATGLTFGH